MGILKYASTITLDQTFQQPLSVNINTYRYKCVNTQETVRYTKTVYYKLSLLKVSAMVQFRYSADEGLRGQNILNKLPFTEGIHPCHALRHVLTQLVTTPLVLHVLEALRKYCIITSGFTLSS